MTGLSNSDESRGEVCVRKIIDKLPLYLHFILYLFVFIYLFIGICTWKFTVKLGYWGGLADA